MATTPSSAPPTASARPLVAALPTTDSLPQAAQAAALRGLPLVVMTTLRGCPYCDLVRTRYLGPMQRDGELIAIQMDMTDGKTALTGFDGAAGFGEFDVDDVAEFGLGVIGNADGGFGFTG